MAISDTLAVRIMDVVKEHELSGNFVMLGRQRWIGKRRKRSSALFDETLAEYYPGLTEADLKNAEDIYSETFFEKIGFDKVDSMDVSEFENATIVQDLAGELPEDLMNRFDVVYDGGTCEHVFDLPTAYRNINKMLKPGGVLIGHSPCNNWINHGFYQITPEMVYGFWEKTLGYEVLQCALQPMLPMFARRVVTTSNPNETGVRPRLKGKLPEGPVILTYAVRKPLSGAGEGEKVYQSDYTQRWAESDTSIAAE
ncbi:class I SAM-dependent methyltransferase [Shimia abyssi]|uniref:Methyltransferase family protein n=1 Tax=Shimia abyssi TaxID=1662395 RepID=A0A2P8F802_9RHOB|nr:class I SAM-dependent methyltransferase [Shimia abyssi]PSL17848.1 methyltransferase family protein [Shimia abyssi]